MPYVYIYVRFTIA